MKMNDFFETFGCDTQHRVQAIFFKYFCIAKPYANGRRKIAD